ncbi:MAG: hypothetical protein CMM87_02655 [Rickettsiales bacterium]|nr:hypothetical protein [Rickettsiales bacterium]|tara:strand:- start:41471 stop:41938 length:468 start_codon:yes stop_codon:yes gene_type:complete
MTTFDLKPLFHSTIGFDRLVDMFDPGTLQSQAKPATYPPYNIVKTGEDRYEIVMAVAGFSKDQLQITLHDNTLKVEAATTNTGDEKVEYLHKGIAMRGFEKSFQLADFIKVKDVVLRNGLLTVSLQREVPEERKPRTIAISEDVESAPSNKQLKS